MTDTEKDELRRAIESGADFAAVIPPGESHLVFAGADELSLTPWPGCGAPMPVATESTAHSVYTSRMEALVGKLRREGGKTVVCRNICGTFRQFDPVAMADAYFDRFPDTLRFIFHRKYCGYWMGATPELLLDMRGGHLETRALAGTRRAGTEEPWSKKNIHEHAIVADDIAGRLDALGLTVAKGNTESMPYGNIEHLCTPISADGADATDVDRIIEALHPTPAVGGFPRNKAIRDIVEFEDNPRNYYGGVLKLRRREGFLAYVVLRTVHFDRRHWCVYTGSGITPESDPEEEWLETEDKARPLRLLLDN